MTWGQLTAVPAFCSIKEPISWYQCVSLTYAIVDQHTCTNMKDSSLYQRKVRESCPQALSLAIVCVAGT